MKRMAIPINIYKGPLFEFRMVKAPDGRYGVFSKIDHLVTDEWSCILLCKEVLEVYYALLHKKELPPPLNSFMDYLPVERAYLKSPQYKADKEFWMSKYKRKPKYTSFV